MPTMIAVAVRDGADGNADVKYSGSSAPVTAGTSANTSCGDGERDREIDTSAAMRTSCATSGGQDAETQETRIAASAEDEDEDDGDGETIARRDAARFAERGEASAAVSSNENAADTRLHRNDTTATNDGHSTDNAGSNDMADSEADSAVLVAERPGSAVEGDASRSAAEPAANRKKRESREEEDVTKAAAVINTGRWTSAEHDLFIQGVQRYGRGGGASKRIAALVKTRTKTQVHTHMQKWWARMERSQKGMMSDEEMLKACSYRNEAEGRSTAAASAAASSSCCSRSGKGETNIGQSPTTSNANSSSSWSSSRARAGERAKSPSSKSRKRQSREDEEVAAASVLLGFNTTVAAAAAAAGTASSRTPSLSNDCVITREAASEAAAATAAGGEGCNTRTVSGGAAAPSPPPNHVPTRQPHALPPPHAGQSQPHVQSPEDYQAYQQYVANNGISHPHHPYQHHQQHHHIPYSQHSYYHPHAQAQAQASAPTALPHVTTGGYHHHHLAASMLPSEVAAQDPSSVAALQAQLNAVKRQVEQLRAENKHIRKKVATVPAVSVPASRTAPSSHATYDSYPYPVPYDSYPYPVGSYSYNNGGEGQGVLVSNNNISSNNNENDSDATRRHCAVGGCRRQSRGSSHSYMCRRHFLERHHNHQLQQYHQQQHQRDQHGLQYYGVSPPITVAGSTSAGNPYNVRRDAGSAGDTTGDYSHYRYAAGPNVSSNSANNVRPVTASSEEDILPPVDREVFRKVPATITPAANADNTSTAKKTGGRDSKRQAKNSPSPGKKANKRKSGASKSSKTAAATTAAKRRKTNPIKKKKTGLPECITHGVRGYRVQPQLAGRSFYVGNVDTLEEAIAFRDMVVKLYDDIVIRLNISRALSMEEQKTIVRNAKVVAMAKIWPGHHVSWMDKGTKEGIDAAKNKRKKEGEAAC